MIERTFDAAFFNRICNLPDVRPWLWPGTEALDVSPLVANPNNYALRTKHGGFILIAHGAGFYSVHTQFSTEGRGAHAVEAMRAGLEYMFTRTDCMRIFSHCPDNNPAALKLAHTGGARDWFRRENHELGAGQTVVWDLFQWVVDEPRLEPEGRAFHEKLEAAKHDMGSELPTHPGDATHDRVVGAASLMAKRGQAAKGVMLYNLWAAAGGYEAIRLVSAEPPVVDVGDGVVSLNDGELEVIECR